MREPAGPVSRERNRMAHCVGSLIPDRAAPKTIADQIKAIPVLAETKLVKVVAGSHPTAAPSFTLAPHKPLVPVSPL